MKRLLVVTIFVVALVAAPARAGLDVSFGANVPVGDDANLFFSISSRYFDRDVRVIEDWGRRYYPNPDDLSVALYLDRYCGKGPEFYFGLRRQGLGWFEISNRCNVQPDVFFVPVQRDPGPPYGKAYGYWKKHKQDPRHAIVLKDADVRNLVAVRMAHEYYGVPVETAMQWRSSGRDVRSVMTGEYKKRHGKGGSGGDQAKSQKGQGQGKKDKNKGKGNQGGKS
ncbi:MAG TPA: hypothetical protein VF139_14325 [Candidatus Polarisedimenticolaceae bacterium]